MKRKRGAAAVTEDLHKKGYTVYRTTFKMTKEEISLAKSISKDGNYVFNHQDFSKDDGKRLQIHFNQIKIDPDQSSENIQLIDRVYQHIRKFCEQEFPIHHVCDPVFILSLPGCTEQPPHCDHNPLLFAVNAYPNVPLGLLLCLERVGTRLVVWEGSHMKARYMMRRKKPVSDEQRKVIRLQIGDILIFRGDLVHSGAAFTAENVRVHCYLDHDNVVRDENTTFPIKRMKVQ